MLQNWACGKIYRLLKCNIPCGRGGMADALDLGSSPARGVGSTPTDRTEQKVYLIQVHLFGWGSTVPKKLGQLTLLGSQLLLYNEAKIINKKL